MPTLFNGCGFGPPLPLTAASSWTWIDHPVSGLQCLTLRPVQTCSRSGSASLMLNLAGHRNSPDRSTKSTRFTFWCSTACKHRVSGSLSLFHSPPGVLFTFPSQYYALSVTKEYLALRGGPRAFHQGSTCLDVLWIPPCRSSFRLRGFHPLWPAFPKPFHYNFQITYAVRTPTCTHVGLGSAGFARRYFRYRCFFLFLRLLRCFSSPGSLPWLMDWAMDT